MKKILFSLSTLLLLLEAKETALEELFEVSGEFRTGAIQTTNDEGTQENKQRTLTTGGYLSLSTKGSDIFKAKATLYSTNTLFGMNEEALFLGSEAQNYSILAEAYVEGEYADTGLRIGRQLIDTPYADTDDIGMIPNTFEAIHLKNETLPNTSLQFLVLDTWSGVDSPKPETFTALQDSEKPLYTFGVSYEGFKDMYLDFWHYKFDGLAYDYLESGYENNGLNLGFQYTNQDHNNKAYGINAEFNYDTLTLKTAHNRVDGIVSNGFGGGPFFTSSEDHTIAEVAEQKATLIGVDYQVAQVTLGILHVAFDKGENETDFLLNYLLNENFTLDIVYANMYKDGKMTKVLTNYNF